MQNFLRGLIYRKSFYAFLSLVLWLDCGTDLADLIQHGQPRDVVSFAASLTGAILVTLIFWDLHRRWPWERR
jgi:hypothetical protein